MHLLIPLVALALGATWLPVKVSNVAAQPRARSPEAAIALGVYIDGLPANPRLLDDFEALTGQRADIAHWYQPWGYTNGAYQPVLDPAALAAITARGATPMITWEAWGPPAKLSTIVAGSFDATIDGWARELKAFGKPIYLRPFHEMNNPAYPWSVGQNGNSAADAVAAWRYVHERFDRMGASNVVWVWSPNTENDQVLFSDIYPGDEYVDWLGVDGYNGGLELSWGGWRSPQEVFQRSFAALVALSPAKPIMIAETGSVETGGSKARWIDELFGLLPRLYPNLRAIVWFQADTSARGEADWRVETSDAALAAFRLAAGPA